jgi:hypothetical protein
MLCIVSLVMPLLIANFDYTDALFLHPSNYVSDLARPGQGAAGAILRGGFCFYGIGWNLCGNVCFLPHLGRLAASNINNHLTTGYAAKSPSRLILGTVSFGGIPDLEGQIPDWPGRIGEFCQVVAGAGRRVTRK